MSDNTNILEEVVATAQKPLVSKEIDRIGNDVQSDPDSKTNQLDEMLKRVPMVSVDPRLPIQIQKVRRPCRTALRIFTPLGRI